MKAQLEPIIISNFLLLLDHSIQNKGAAFFPYSGLFYPIDSDINGYYSYASPFKPLCNDTSISGANVLSGLYINGVYNPIGSGHFKRFNHYKGVAYFDQNYPNNTIISGNCSVKEFGIELSDQPEWKLLFETKYTNQNMFSQNLSGLHPNEKTAPIIYVVFKGQQNDPFAFTHLDNSKINLRCVIISDNEFQSLNVCSILKNLYQFNVPILQSLPFNSIGGTTGELYNYKTIPTNNIYSVLVSDARSVDISQKGDFKDIVRNLALVDFTLSTIVQNTSSI